MRHGELAQRTPKRARVDIRTGEPHSVGVLGGIVGERRAQGQKRRVTQDQAPLGATARDSGRGAITAPPARPSRHRQTFVCDLLRHRCQLCHAQPLLARGVLRHVRCQHLFLSPMLCAPHRHAAPLFCLKEVGLSGRGTGFLKEGGGACGGKGVPAALSPLP